MAEPVAEETPMAVFDAPAYAAPSVNLLPPEIGQRRALRKLQAGLAAGVVAAAAVVGLLYVQAGSGKSEAQARLNAANTQKVILGAQTASLAHVSAEKAKIDAARASLKSAMGSEVLWSKTLDDLRLRLPDGVRYQSVAVSAVVAPTAGVADAGARRRGCNGAEQRHRHGGVQRRRGRHESCRPRTGPARAGARAVERLPHLRDQGRDAWFGQLEQFDWWFG